MKPSALRGAEPLLWRQAPEEVEHLIREALTTDRPISDAIRGEMEVSLAYALMHQRRFQEARAAVASALRRRPDDDQALLCDAMLSFFLEETGPGPWDRFEARWTTDYFGDQPVPRHHFWDGSPLRGRSVLLAGEGGMGDQIQFVRFAATLKALGAGRLIVSAHPPLLPLFAAMPGIDMVVPTRMPSNTLAAAVAYDVAIPMASIPRYCPPAAMAWPVAPYLHVTPAATAAARRQIADLGARFNVGLCWHSHKAVRRIPLDMFRPLAELPGVRLFALGEKAVVQHDITAFPIVDLSSDILATAAAITALDLVITVDTMTAHLAGALDRPAWVLLHYVPDWRWLATGTSSTWYPSLRLFRQEQCDWRPVVEDVAAALRDVSAAAP